MAGLAIVIGIAVGLLAVTLLSPAMSQRGARADLSRPMSISPGDVIPEVEGTARIKGTLLWADEIKEHKKTKREGGGFLSKGTKVTTYSYTATYAIGVCRTDQLPGGKIVGLQGAWRDKKLQWDFRPSDEASDPLSEAAGQAWYNEHVTEYTGEETQTADPTIEAVEGVGNVPAFRGWAYIVVTADDVTRRGASIPDWEFLVVAEGERDQPSGLDYVYGLRPYQIGVTDSGYYYEGYGDQYEWSENACPHSGGGNSGDAGWYPTLQAAIDVGRSKKTTGQYEFVKVFEQSFTGQGIGGATRVHMTYMSEPWAELMASADDEFTGSTEPCNWGANSRYNYQYTSINRGGYGGGYLTGVDRVYTVAYNARSESSGIIYPPFAHDQAWNGIYQRYILFGNSVLVYYDVGFEFTDCEETTCTAGNPFETEWVSIPDYPNWCVNKYGQIAPNGPGVVIESGAFRALVDYPVTTADPDAVGPVIESTHPDYDNQDFWEREAARAGIDGVYGVDYPQVITTACQYTAAWSDNIVSGDPITLSSVIKSDLAQAGITAAMVDTTDIDGILITGRYVDSDDTIAERIEHILQVFQLDAAAYDGKITFLRRDNAAPISLDWSEFGAMVPGADAGEGFSRIDVDRPQEVELPRRTSLIYQSADDLHSQATESAERWEVSATGEKQTKSRVVMGVDQAAQTVDILHQSQWGQLYGRVEFTLDRAYSHLVPGDWIKTTSDEGTQYQIRIVEMENQGNGLILFRGVEDRPANYVSYAKGQRAIDPTQPGAIISGPTILTIADTHNLADGEDVYGLRIATTGLYSSWPGGSVYRSIDGGSTFDGWYDAADQGPVGTLETALAASDDLTTKAAEAFTINIGLHFELASVTDTLFYSRRQLILVGSEVIAFRDAAQDSVTGFWVCSHLLRGLRGTDPAAHSAGERIVLLSGNGVDFNPLDQSELGATRIYRGVTDGFDEATGADTSHQYIGKNLTEWPVTSASMTGRETRDLVISFRHVGRRGTAFACDHSPHWTGHEVDILSGGTVLRTLTSTSESAVVDVTYSAADQLADFGSYQQSVDVVIYATSSITGRGEPLSATLTATEIPLTADSTMYTADDDTITADQTTVGI